MFEYTCIYPKSQKRFEYSKHLPPSWVKVMESSCDPIIVLLRETDITKMESMHKN